MAIKSKVNYVYIVQKIVKKTGQVDIFDTLFPALETECVYICHAINKLLQRLFWNTFKIFQSVCYLAPDIRKRFSPSVILLVRFMIFYLFRNIEVWIFLWCARMLF